MKEINIDLAILSEATSEIDGGCSGCICSFLNKLPHEISKEIAEWINKNNPIYGCETLFYENKRWESADEVGNE